MRLKREKASFGDDKKEKKENIYASVGNYVRYKCCYDVTDVSFCVGKMKVIDTAEKKMYFDLLTIITTEFAKGFICCCFLRWNLSTTQGKEK